VDSGIRYRNRRAAHERIDANVRPPRKSHERVAIKVALAKQLDHTPGRPQYRDRNGDRERRTADAFQQGRPEYIEMLFDGQ
jgi:hypothetical protein